MAFDSTPDQLGLKEALLNPIINKTEASISEMTQLNNTINGIGQQIGIANVSDSGRILVEKIGVWNSDYVKLKSALDQLNTRVRNMQAALVAANADAARASTTSAF
jgi:outer membrane murein-binding lipoprotein Lpp